jgi:hypothetical protein
MSVFLVFIYTVKTDKLDEFGELVKKWSKWVKKHPDLHKGVKSWKLFSQTIGGNVGGYVEM